MFEDTVDILDVKVPIEFYKALNPVREITNSWVEDNVTEEMVIALREFLDDVIKQTLADTELNIRSGRLHGAVLDSLEVFGSGVVNNIGAHLVVPYWVAAHEYGAEIHPREAKVLCVPLPPALRADGSPKRRYPALWKPMGTFTYKSAKTGKSYLAYKDGQTLVVLYVYVDVVTLPARLGLRAHYLDMLPILMAMWESILATNLEAAYFGFLGELE